MNASINLLSQTAAKKSKLIIGLMSGTSLDGLDIALCEIKGSSRETELKLLEFKTIAFPDGLSEKLKKVVSVETISARELTILNTLLGDYHGQLVLNALDEWQTDTARIDCIASHGQSIYHAPALQNQRESLPNATLQMGDGDHIAHKTGILTISDFRQKHTAAGGEGAPMVSLVDELLFRDETENRILLNIGGIANFTCLPAYENSTKVITTDTGPGNTLINKAAQIFFNKPFDKNGNIAKGGSVRTELLNELVNQPFFKADAPKSTGPELFNMDWVKAVQAKTSTENIPGDDLIATLTDLTAQTIAEAIKKACGNETAIYLSGGGMHNGHLIGRLENILRQKTHSFEEMGFNPDAKEAACFAVLANEMLSGKPFTLNGKAVNFGKISLPV